MAHEFAKGFYASAAWRRCRAAYIRHRQAIDGGMCEQCGEQLGYIVHHLVELTPSNINDSSITLAWSNLQFVCKDCHDKAHGYCGRSLTGERRRVSFDAQGNPVLME